MGKFNEKLKENYYLVPLIGFAIFIGTMLIIAFIGSMN